VSIGVGDVVRTRAGHVRQVTSVLDGGRARSYALMPLVGSPGRRSYAETVTLVRTWELAAVYAYTGDVRRRHEQGRADAAASALDAAVRLFALAERRGEDGAGELEAARRALSLAALILTRDDA
jgi:hypothetical protein